MASLISKSADAEDWITNNLLKHTSGDVFGKIKTAVLWTDEKGGDGKALVAVDPVSITEEINLTGMSLLKGHDPGCPVGKVLSAAIFTTPDGTKFIAGILGLYQGSKQLSLNDLGLGQVTPSLPRQLPALTDAARIEFSVDPREVGVAWVEDVLASSPIRVEQHERSHNAADTVVQLVSVGLPYAVLVWNPFVKAIANEAGKDTYAAMKKWLRQLFEKLSKLDNPIVDISSYHHGCKVSFIIRCADANQHYIALEALSTTAQTAAALVHKMASAGFLPVRLVYEYRKEDENWFPSFAELENGRLITDNAKLLAVEELPMGLSLGLRIKK